MTPGKGDAVEAVRARIDIVDLVQSYVSLKKTGQNFKGLCPFHDEKSPSFVVSPARQTYHCFGCGEKGSAFDFIMRYERIEFRAALEMLAERAGVRLETFEAEDGQREPRQSKSRLLDLHEKAAIFFREQLMGPAGASARAYLESRGIDHESSASFVIGLSPPGWRGLCDWAQRKGFDEREIELAGLGLAGNRSDGIYDRFRGRLMFPIKDGMSRVIAFGARSLDGSEPKYLNSPETPLFQKGKALYGVHGLRGHRRENPILVMEGYTDVILSTQCGVAGAVATLGTALTPEHARILSRYADRTCLVFDGDAAGLKAAERGAAILLEHGLLDLAAIVLPDRQDPADFFVQRGKAGVAELLSLAQPLLEFLIDRTSVRHDLQAVEGRRAAARDLTSTASQIKDPVARELVLERIAERLRISHAALQSDLAQRIQRPREARSRRPEAAQSASDEPVDLGRRARKDVIEACLNEPSLLEGLDLEVLSLDLDPKTSDLLLQWQNAALAGPVNPAQLLELVPTPALREAVRRLLLPEEHQRALASQLKGAILRLKELRVEAEIRRHKSRDEGPDLREIQRLMAERKGRRSAKKDP